MIFQKILYHPTQCGITQKMQTRKKNGVQNLHPIGAGRQDHTYSDLLLESVSPYSLILYCKLRTLMPKS